MERELKFKAWNKKTKQIIKIEPLTSIKSFMDNTHYLTAGTIDGGFYINLDEVELMQFTGLKDKNGKEIYKGDIINCKHWNPENYKVIFREGGFCLADKDNKFMADINMIQDSTGIHFEIIGNIYENSELLS